MNSTTEVYLRYLNYKREWRSVYLGCAPLSFVEWCFERGYWV